MGFAKLRFNLTAVIFVVSVFLIYDHAIKVSMGRKSTEEELLLEIQDKLKPPSSEEFPKVTHSNKSHASQAYQSQYIDKVTGGLRGGFFVECGAADGLKLSNSLFFERERGWTGLLVEANPTLFEQIQSNKRRSYSINACMSLSAEPSEVLYKKAGLLSGIDSAMDNHHLSQISRWNVTTEDVTMKCYPLHRMLQALGQNHVHYFSLDVEGPELDILKTIPFSHVIIDFLTVEYRVVGSPKETVKKLHEIRDFVLGTKHYEQIALLSERDVFEGSSMAANEAKGLDVLFKRRSVQGNAHWNH